MKICCGVNRKHASAESGIWNLAFKRHRKISNFSVVFEPNSKFPSPQKRVCTRIYYNLRALSNQYIPYQALSIPL